MINILKEKINIVYQFNTNKFFKITTFEKDDISFSILIEKDKSILTLIIRPNYDKKVDKFNDNSARSFTFMGIA